MISLQIKTMNRLQRLHITLLIFIVGLNFTTNNAYSEATEYDSLFKRALSYKHISTDSIQKHLNSIYQNFDSIENPSFKCRVLTELTISCMKSGNFTNAIFYCNEALALVEKHNLIKEKIDVLMSLGTVYRKVGLTSEALRLLFSAENLITNSSEDQKATLYNYLAITYQSMGNTEKHREYAHRSASVSNIKDFPSIAVGAYSHLANSFYNVDSIIKYQKFAFEIIEENPHLNYEKVVLLNNMALIEKALANFDKSNNYYLEAIEIARAKGYKNYLANIYNNYAYLLMARHQFKSARYYLDEGVKLAKEQKDTDLTASIYDSYSDYYKKINDYKNAYLYKDTSIRKRNQYKKKQQLERSMFLSSVFESEKQQKELIEKESKLNRMQSIVFISIAIILLIIVILVYYIQKSSHNKTKAQELIKERELNIAKAIIEGQDTERKRLAMDLHDGIAPQVATLRMLLDTHLPKGDTSIEVINILNNTYNDIRNLSHRMLPVQIDEIGLVRSLKNLFINLNRSNEILIHFETDIEESLGLNLDTNLYHLTYELVFNAIKHSGGNQIIIHLYNDNDLIELSIEDNGSGFDYYKVKHGLGLKNIEYRIEHLGGKLIFDSQPNEGTAFMVEIPK